MRKLTFAALSVTALLAVSSNDVFSQKKEDAKPAETVTCEQLVAKPLTAEQYKQLPSDEARKQYDEQLKVCKEGLATNAKAKNANEIVNRTLKEGSSALEAKDFATAIAKFDEGYNADTEYWGSAPVMLRNKAIALRARGAETYNAAAKNKDAAARTAGKAAAAKDFQASADSLQKALDILNKSAVPTEATQAKNFQNNKTAAIADRAESYRLLVISDSSKATDGAAAFEQYVAIETDPAKKQKFQSILAQSLFASGDFDKAIPAYQKILTENPNNPDALYFLGSMLVSVDPENKAKVQEGIGYFERFVKSAPANFDQEKINDAKGQIEGQTAALKGSSKPAGGKRKN